MLYSRSLLAIYFICEKLVAQSCLCNLRDYNRPVFLCPWSSSGKNTGVGCHALFQEIFPTQGSNLGLLHCRQILYLLSQQGANFKCSSSKHKTCPGASALQFLLVLLAKCCPISHPLSQGGFSLCRWNKGSVSFHHLCPFSSFSEDCSIEEAPLQTWRVFSVAST